MTFYSKGLIPAIVKVTDPQSGSAVIKHGTALLTERSETLNSKRFKSCKKDELYLVKFKISGSSARRYIMGVSLADETTIEQTIKQIAKIDGAEEDAVATEPTIIEKKKHEPVTPGAINHGIFFTPEQALLFNMADIAAKKSTVRLSAVGPSGYGKTDMARAFAEATGRDHLYWNCATVRDPEEWFGYREAEDGSTIFVPTEFTKSVREGNCVIVLDEFNRVESWLHNTLFPLLDDRGETLVHGETIKVGPNVVFVMTLNMGFQFTGTFEIDTAMINRVDGTYRVAPLPKGVEAKIVHERFDLPKEVAKRIVIAIDKVRSLVEKEEMMVDVSTRTTLKIARWVATGMSVKQAFTFSVTNILDAEDAKMIMDALNTIS